MKPHSRWHLNRALRTAALASLVLTLATARIASASTLININFNDSTALSWIVNQARGTFAAASQWNGAISFCPGGGLGCWQYAQPTTDDDQNFFWFYVYDWSPTTAGTGAYHYHLPFEDQTIGACLIDPGDGDGAGYGRLINGSCVAPNWSSEPRFLMAEDRDAQVQMLADGWREFTPWSIDNKTAVPIQIWVLATDGNWYFADNVGIGTTTWLNEIANNLAVWQVSIGVGTSYTGYGPFVIDNFYIQYP